MSVRKVIEVNQTASFTLDVDLDAAGARSVIWGSHREQFTNMSVSGFTVAGVLGPALIGANGSANAFDASQGYWGFPAPFSKLRFVWTITGAGVLMGRIYLLDDIIMPFGQLAVGDSTVSAGGGLTVDFLASGRYGALFQSYRLFASTDRAAHVNVRGSELVNTPTPYAALTFAGATGGAGVTGWLPWHKTMRFQLVNDDGVNTCTMIGVIQASLAPV